MYTDTHSHTDTPTHTHTHTKAHKIYTRTITKRQTHTQRYALKDTKAKSHKQKIYTHEDNHPYIHI